MTRNLRLDEMGNAERLTRNAGWQPVERENTGFAPKNHRDLQQDAEARRKEGLRTAVANLQRFIQDDAVARDGEVNLKIALYAVHSELSRISALV